MIWLDARFTSTFTLDKPGSFAKVHLPHDSPWPVITSLHRDVLHRSFFHFLLTMVFSAGTVSTQYSLYSVFMY